MVQTGSSLDRRSLIVALIQQLNRRGSWSGSTHVQKCAFFLQHLYGLDMGYSFVIYHYGPYSFDLEEELALGRWQGWVTVEPDPSGYGVHYQPGTNHPEGGSGLSDAHRRVVDAVVDRLGGLRVRQLELLATTYYLQKGLDGRIRDEEKLVADVLALKPHFDQEDVQKAIQELAEIERMSPGQMA